MISSPDHLRVVDNLLIVVPCTMMNRHWTNHMRLSGTTQLSEVTFAMTEQPRTLARSRVAARAGFVDDACLGEVVAWVHHWITPPVAG